MTEACCDREISIAIDCSWWLYHNRILISRQSLSQGQKPSLHDKTFHVVTELAKPGIFFRDKVCQDKGKVCHDRASVCRDRVGQQREIFCRNRGFFVAIELATTGSSTKASAHDRRTMRTIMSTRQGRGARLQRLGARTTRPRGRSIAT